MEELKSVIITVSILCFLTHVSAETPSPVLLSPSPSTVNNTISANVTTNATIAVNATISANATSLAAEQTVSSGHGQDNGQGNGQGQGKPESGQSAAISPSSTSNSVVLQGTVTSGGQSGQGQGQGQLGASAFLGATPTSSVVPGQSADSGGQSSGGQSGQGQGQGQLGASAFLGVTPTSSVVPGQSADSGGQSSGGQPSSGGYPGLAYPENLTPEQKSAVETFDIKRKEFMQKLELKSQVRPMTTKNADIDFLSIFGSLLKDSQTFGQDYNTRFKANIDYTINTASTALQTKKFDCVKQRKNKFPPTELVNPHSAGAAANSISLPLECPLIVKKAPVSRKRRDVDYSVELKLDHYSSDDPVEYAHMYRYVRARREAAEQQNSSCSGSPCLDARLNMTLKITSKNYTAELGNKETQQYKTLIDSIRNLLVTNITNTKSEWKVKIHGFELSSGSVGVSFFVDCPVSYWSDIKGQLDLIAGAALFGSYVIDPSFSKVRKVTVVDGGWSVWSVDPWPDKPSGEKLCGKQFQVERTRTCTNPSPQNGGKHCEGVRVEYKKCTCGGTLENTGGTISSPYSPTKNYPMDTECTWILKAPFNHSVVLKFDTFELESDKKCFYDYVQIFEDNDASKPLIPRTCGTQGFNQIIKSSGTIMVIKFRSDKSVTHKGFRATWTKVVQPWKPKAPIAYEEQNITVTTLISCPTYNESSVPLGKATTCPDKSLDGDCYFKNPAYLISCLIGVQTNRKLPLEESSKVNATFKHIMHKDLFPDYYTKGKYCVTWNSSLSKSLSGAWTRKGCSVFSTNFTHTICQCDHTGVFAVLTSEKQTVYKKLSLLANTYTGIGVSFFLLLVALFHIVWKVNIHGGEVMRMNICIAIIVMMITFLIGANVEAEKTLCGFLAFLLLYSVFAKFLWLMLHGLRIHGKIKEVFASGFNIEIVYVIFGWGLPLVLSLIAIGIQVNINNEKDVCWTAIAGGSMWGYSAPLIVIVFLNIFVLVAIVIPTEERKNNYDYKEMKYRVIKDAVLLALFGITCIAAYFTVAQETFTPQYFLTISVVLQSVAMIIFGREGRKDYVKRKAKRVDNAETLSQNTNEEDFPEKFDCDSGSDGRSSRKSKKSNSPARVKHLKNGKEQETDIDA